MPPAISHVLETCLYVKSITTSVDFYQKLLGVKPFLSTVNFPFFPLQPPPVRFSSPPFCLQHMSPKEPPLLCVKLHLISRLVSQAAHRRLRPRPHHPPPLPTRPHCLRPTPQPERRILPSWSRTFTGHHLSAHLCLLFLIKFLEAAFLPGCPVTV
jgi:hypothetical protein